MRAEEQRDYYISQFEKLQPDLHGAVSGPSAKEFFEKSKLPVADLSRIWQVICSAHVLCPSAIASRGALLHTGRTRQNSDDTEHTRDTCLLIARHAGPDCLCSFYFSRIQIQSTLVLILVQ